MMRRRRAINYRYKLFHADQSLWAIKDGQQEMDRWMAGLMSRQTVGVHMYIYAIPGSRCKLHF